MTLVYVPAPYRRCAFVGTAAWAWSRVAQNVVYACVDPAKLAKNASGPGSSCVHEQMLMVKGEVHCRHGGVVVRQSMPTRASSQTEERARDTMGTQTYEGESAKRLNCGAHTSHGSRFAVVAQRSQGDRYHACDTAACSRVLSFKSPALPVPPVSKVNAGGGDQFSRMLEACTDVGRSGSLVALRRVLVP